METTDWIGTERNPQAIEIEAAHAAYRKLVMRCAYLAMQFGAAGSRPPVPLERLLGDECFALAETGRRLSHSLNSLDLPDDLDTLVEAVRRT